MTTTEQSVPAGGQPGMAGGTVRAEAAAHEEAVVRERRGAALWLRLNRPEAMNGLHPDLLAGLVTGLDEADGDPGIRAVVLTGTGRAFCAGADLKYGQELTGRPRPPGQYSPMQLFLRDVLTVLTRIEQSATPVIAAVQGLALGGGLELMMCCDFAVAARSARLGDGHAVYGQIPGGGASVRLPQRVGLTRAKYLMFTGELFAAESFLDTDLLTAVVDDEHLVAEVDRIADVIATRSPIGLARMKRLLNDVPHMPPDVGLRVELEQSALHELSPDWREGITAFTEKRPPSFPGR